MQVTLPSQSLIGLRVTKAGFAIFLRKSPSSIFLKLDATLPSALRGENIPHLALRSRTAACACGSALSLWKQRKLLAQDHRSSAGLR